MSSKVPIVLVLLCLVAGSASPAGAAASLVADVNRVESLVVVEAAVSGPFLPLGNKVLFEAYEPGSGRELWVSDGTSLGTEILRDICPGRCPSDVQILGAIREQIAVFEAEVGFDHRLWRSDGTRQGTFPLVSQEGRAVSTCRGFNDSVLATGRSIYFSGRETGDCGLWTADGTREGTRLVKSGEPQDLTRAGEKVFFREGVGLWVSDGTPAGTVLLGEWRSTGISERPHILGALGSRVLFVAPENGDELWVSDGTPAGTKPITDIAAPEPFERTPSAEVFDGVAYFLVDDVTSGVDLWRSDGTQAGTRRVTAFGFASPFPGALRLARIGDRLVFVADDGLTGPRWWASRGTPETTAPIPCSGTCPNLGDLGPFRPSLEFAVLGGQVLFPATDALHGEELWATDGTTAPRRLKDLCPQTCFTSPREFNLAGGLLFFVAFGSIWKTDGTPAGTVPLVPQGEVHPVLREPPFHVARAGGRFFFAAESEGRPRQLWTSDGTPAGSAPVTVIGIGDGSDPESFAALGDRIFFTACDGFERNLWRSDGTAAGTVPLDVGHAEGCNSGERIEGIRAAGGYLFFTRFGALFRTDGTLSGTVRLTPAGVSAGGIVPFGTGVAFSASDEDFRSSLWTSDGTAAGTRQRLEWPHSFSILEAFGPDLYFASYPSGDSPAQLLATNGTLAGTRVVATLDPFVRDLSNLTRIGNSFFFIADGRRQIWTTSPGGTGTLPLEAGPEERPREPRALEALGGTLYALALADGFRSQEERMELWRIDGTSGEVSLVRDVAPGDELADRSRLVAAAGRLFFAGNDGEHGVELWESDGTEAGTRMVEDVAPGPSSSYPTELTPAGDRLYFAADDGVHGREPWVLPLGSPACQPAEFTLCLGGGRFKVEADWRDFDGNSGRGRAVSLTADTGYFWFFAAANVEVILKVLDGRGVNDHHWVFYGALSTVRYVLTVTDTQTGAARRYINPSGLLGSVGDTQAFGLLGATGSSLTIGPEAVAFAPLITEGRSAKEGGTCAPSSTRLCLNGGRFAVEARWRDFDGNQGNGMAVPLAGGDTGYFWFFNQENVEVVLKVLDGRPVNGRFWVFYGALSSVEYTLTVTDTMTGARKVYTNPSGRLASGADTGAF